MHNKSLVWIFAALVLVSLAHAVGEAQIYTGTGSNGLTSAGYNSAIATAYQCFVANHTYELEKISIGLRYQAGQTSGTVTLWMYNGAAGKPTTAIVKSITNLSGSSVTSSFANYTFNFTPTTTLTNGNNYCFVVNSTTLNTGAYYNLESAGAGSGTNAVGYGNPQATTWTIAGSDVMPYLTTYKPVEAGNSTNASIQFLSPTPSNGAKFYYHSANYINFRTNVTGATVGNVTVYLYNATTFVGAVASVGIGDVILNFDGLQAGVYYLNATLRNGTTVLASTTTRTITIYDLDLAVNEPVANQAVNSSLFISYNTTITPVGGVSIGSYKINLLNANGSYNRTIAQMGFNNYTWATYPENLSIAQYRLNITALDTEGRNHTVLSSLFNITRNAQLNISVGSLLNNVTINNFSGYAYDDVSGLNVSFSTTTGLANLDVIRGTYSVFVESPDYATTNTSNYANVTINSAYGNYRFYLYDTNTLNITFYDQTTNAKIINQTIYMDLIGSITSYNVSTTNSTLYLTLLQPNNYTMRYYSTGYETRFYYMEVANKSYQNLNLYLLNNTLNYPVNVTIIDEDTNLVSGARVKALRFDIATNTYILREVGSTTDQGKTTLQLTYNDEFYKFMVEYDGVLYLTTAPAYITSPTYQLQIILQGTTGTEYYDYTNLYKNVSFLSGTNSFRLTYDDGSGASNQVCLQVIKIGGGVVNQSCVTSSSLTITLGLTPQAGATFTGKAYRVVDGKTEFLDSASHTYPKSTSFGRFGLFIQFLISSLVAFLVVIDIPLVLIAVPASLLVGYWFGLHNLSLVTIVVLIVVGIIIAYIVRRATQ